MLLFKLLLGGFYQDVMGYTGVENAYGLGCKLCPPGTYIHPHAAPGKAITECTSCPQGNKNALPKRRLQRAVSITLTKLQSK